MRQPAIDAMDRVRATGRMLDELLRADPDYRDRWVRRAGRRIASEINHAAVARVIAEQLWDSGQRADSRTMLARELKDRVARALSGTTLTAETLQWFIDAFEIRADHARRLRSRYSGDRTPTVVGSLAHPRPLVVEQHHRTVAVFEHHRLGADGQPTAHTTVHALTALDRPVERYVYVPPVHSTEVTVEHGGTIDGPVMPFGDGLEALGIRLSTALEPGDVASLCYLTRFHERQSPNEFRRFAHGRTDNVDIKVSFDACRLPEQVWWVVWDDYRSGRPIVEEEVDLDAGNSAHRFLNYIEQAVVGFRWQWQP